MERKYPRVVRTFAHGPRVLKAQPGVRTAWLTQSWCLQDAPSFLIQGGRQSSSYLHYLVSKVTSAQRPPPLCPLKGAPCVPENVRESDAQGTHPALSFYPHFESCSGKSPSPGPALSMLVSAQVHQVQGLPKESSEHNSPSQDEVDSTLWSRKDNCGSS